MVELGELEKRHADFDKINTRVVVVSVEGLKDAKETQEDFPHLVVVSDADMSLTKVADVIHPQNGKDTAAPANLLIDQQGIVRWESRPESYLKRLTPDEVLDAVDKHVGNGDK
jgi:alkyl hydroperoxide reductase subunit AhpC